MHPEHSPTAIARRLREILVAEGQTAADAAARLGVGDVELQSSIDVLDPRPTIDVLVAVIREHGVDPHWLLTGIYDAAMHRAAVGGESDGSKEAIARLIARQLATPRDVDAQPAGEPPLNA